MIAWKNNWFVEKIFNSLTKELKVEIDKDDFQSRYLCFIFSALAALWRPFDGKVVFISFILAALNIETLIGVSLVACWES